jgi:hypothetical protein
MGLETVLAFGRAAPPLVKGVYASAAPVVLARREGNGICCQDALQPVSLNRHRCAAAPLYSPGSDPQELWRIECGNDGY